MNTPRTILATAAGLLLAAGAAGGAYLAAPTATAPAAPVHATVVDSTSTLAPAPVAAPTTDPTPAPTPVATPAPVAPAAPTSRTAAPAPATVAPVPASPAPTTDPTTPAAAAPRHAAAGPGEPVAPLLTLTPGGSEAHGPVGSPVCPNGQQPVVDPATGAATCR